jgi:hypothetical protein
LAFERRRAGRTNTSCGTLHADLSSPWRAERTLPARVALGMWAGGQALLVHSLLVRLVRDQNARHQLDVLTGR